MYFVTFVTFFFFCDCNQLMFSFSRLIFYSAVMQHVSMVTAASSPGMQQQRSPPRPPSQSGSRVEQQTDGQQLQQSPEVRHGENSTCLSLTCLSV